MLSQMEKTQPLQQSAYPAKCGTCAMLQQAPLACTDCHTVLAHVLDANYFEIFGLAPSFDIDQQRLNEKYLGISRNIHPDRFATSGDEMQDIALRLSAAINQAYAALKDPFRRAEYLLETHGGKSASQDKRVPPSLLGEVLMLREEIEEAKASGDQRALSEIREQVLATKRAADAALREQCRSLVADPTDETRDELRLQLNGMKYIDNVLKEL